MPTSRTHKLSTTQIEEAVNVLRAGGTVVFPTGTAYGLAVDAHNLRAVKKLYALKGRSFKKPIHVIVSSLAQAKRLVEFNRMALNIASKFWPGPLTLVLPLKPATQTRKTHTQTLKILSANTKTLGVRMAETPLMEELVKALGSPITATSANISGKSTAYSVAQVKAQFDKHSFKPDYYLDVGELKSILPSTIIQIDGRHVTLLRSGPIDFHQIIKHF